MECDRVAVYLHIQLNAKCLQVDVSTNKAQGTMKFRQKFEYVVAESS